MKGLPYAKASSGRAARGEITELLRRFGCESIGFMDNFEEHSVLLAFKHRGRDVQLKASAKGWAQMFVKENPWNGRRACSEQEWKNRAMHQGLIAINSILRDWVKGQVMAIECGVFSFEAVFFPHMIGVDGRPLLERLKTMPGLLESPTP